MSLAWQAANENTRNNSYESKRTKPSINTISNLKLKYTPVIRHYRRRIIKHKPKVQTVDTKLNSAPKINPKEIMSAIQMLGNSKMPKDWTVRSEKNRQTYSVSWVNMVDTSLKEIYPTKSNGLKYVEESDEYTTKPQNPKKSRWKLFVCLITISLVVIVPVLGATLFQFVSCYQMINTNNEGTYMKRFMHVKND